MQVLPSSGGDKLEACEQLQQQETPRRRARYELLYQYTEQSSSKYLVVPLLFSDTRTQTSCAGRVRSACHLPSRAAPIYFCIYRKHHASPATILLLLPCSLAATFLPGCRVVSQAHINSTCINPIHTRTTNFLREGRKKRQARKKPCSLLESRCVSYLKHCCN